MILIFRHAVTWHARSNNCGKSGHEAGQWMMACTTQHVWSFFLATCGVVCTCAHCNCHQSYYTAGEACLNTNVPELKKVQESQTLTLRTQHLTDVPHRRRHCSRLPTFPPAPPSPAAPQPTTPAAALLMTTAALRPGHALAGAPLPCCRCRYCRW
jgi:hypothetical protein